MADLVWVKWYATVFRKDTFDADVARVAPLALRYGATQYQVHVDNDDRYRDGPEMIEFRAANVGRFQVPVAYNWADEIASGSLGPEVPTAEPNGAPNGA